MRTTSLYDFNCECGKHLTTPDPVIECPGCGRQIHVEWPARLETVTEPVSPPWPLERLDATVSIEWTDPDDFRSVTGDPTQEPD